MAGQWQTSGVDDAGPRAHHVAAAEGATGECVGGRVDDEEGAEMLSGERDR